MKITCTLTLEYDNEKKAENILKSTKVDDLNYVKSQRNKKQIKSTIESKSISSLLHTLDDYLACIKVAEKIVDKD